MQLINNKKHTIIKKDGVFNFNYNQYRIFEYCKILDLKDEVKHPTYKKQILKIYNL